MSTTINDQDALAKQLQGLVQSLDQLQLLLDDLATNQTAIKEVLKELPHTQMSGLLDEIWLKAKAAADHPLIRAQGIESDRGLYTYRNIGLLCGRRFIRDMGTPKKPTWEFNVIACAERLRQYKAMQPNWRELYERERLTPYDADQYNPDFYDQIEDPLVYVAQMQQLTSAAQL